MGRRIGNGGILGASEYYLYTFAPVLWASVSAAIFPRPVMEEKAGGHFPLSLDLGYCLYLRVLMSAYTACKVSGRLLQAIFSPQSLDDFAVPIL